MFTYDFEDTLRKRVRKLRNKNPVLAEILRRKVKEVTSLTTKTIDTYKNLKHPHNQYKRIHLTGNYILLFTVDKKAKHILFVDILHWDKAYR